jgi:hypothetical protein
MVGWFQATLPGSSGAMPMGLLYERAAEALGLSSQEMWDLLCGLRTEKVLIEDVEDWCIDYTYGNPSLWLVSASGSPLSSLFPSLHPLSFPCHAIPSTPTSA